MKKATPSRIVAYIYEVPKICLKKARTYDTIRLAGRKIGGNEAYVISSEYMAFTRGALQFSEDCRAFVASGASSDAGYIVAQDFWQRNNTRAITLLVGIIVVVIFKLKYLIFRPAGSFNDILDRSLGGEKIFNHFDAFFCAPAFLPLEFAV